MTTQENSYQPSNCLIEFKSFFLSIRYIIYKVYI